MKTFALTLLLALPAGAGMASSTKLAIFDQLIARQERQDAEAKAREAEALQKHQALDRALAAKPTSGHPLRPSGSHSAPERGEVTATHPNVSLLLGKLDRKAAGLVIRGGRRLWLAEVYSDAESCHSTPRSSDFEARLAPGRNLDCLEISKLQEMVASHDIRLAGKVDIPFQAFARSAPGKAPKS